MATKYMYTPIDDQLNKLGSIAQEKDCDLLVTKWMTRKRVGQFDLKTETSHRWALVVIPLGGDGGIGHAFTIVRDLIFDSSQSHALKFGKTSLDWCCANDRGFESIYIIRERHMPVVILMPRVFLELKFLFLELLDFNSPF
jgi:hypothetical protein